MSQISEDAVRATLATVREQLTEEITEAIEQAVREERSAVVRFIREQQEEAFKKDKDLNMDRMTSNIERGEHRREEEE
jgi:polyribonucleotide nucleotidyltransferase